MFGQRTVERVDSRRDYGERRVIALGRAQNIPLTVVTLTGSRSAESSLVESFRPERVTVVNVKRTKKPRASKDQVLRGRADLGRLRRMSEREIHATSPKELADLPSEFWEQARIVEPSAKQAISLRVDTDVLGWFKRQGPRYQSRINAVLRSYMTQRRQSSRKAG